MDQCYALVAFTADTPGSLDDCVDCAYVLTMEGSPREASIREQIARAGLTSRVIFQYNRGYKKCPKRLRKNGPNYDLEHAQKNAFRHALAAGHSRILMFEDDCEFDERIKDPEIIEDVKSFLTEKDPSVYTFGSFLLLPNPLDVLAGSKHQLLLYNSSTHAVVYNRRYMEWVATNDCLLGHVDFETNRHASKYTYRVPLAYQKITETENSREGWGHAYPIMRALIFGPLDLAARVQPGYDIIKRWADTISVILLVLAARLFFPTETFVGFFVALGAYVALCRPHCPMCFNKVKTPGGKTVHLHHWLLSLLGLLVFEDPFVRGLLFGGVYHGIATYDDWWKIYH